MCAAWADPSARLKLEYVPPIDDVVPSGKATIDQARRPGTLSCEVQNVNLPDGTAWVVSVSDYRAGIHLRLDNESGLRVGGKITRNVVERISV